MKIKEFGVEIWMNEYENSCLYNLAETCVESLTIEQLLDMAGKRETILNELLPMKLTYGAIEGSDRLRNNITEIYQNQQKENILITHGAIGANALIHQTLVEPGDRVVSVLPTYQQHYSIPESFGADVQIVKLKEENNFLPDLEELQKLTNSNTRLITINNPNNPTGALMDEAFLKQIVDIARACDAYLLCDEVYRGTDASGDGFTASIADLYEKGISTASMSKSFSLAGLRLGWIAAPTDVIHAVTIHRDYNTISVGMLDDHFACIALECKEQILERSRSICQANREVLDAWISNEPLISYVKPQSGTVALLKYDLDMSSREFCVRLLESKGVMFTPGSVLEMEGYVRIGYANNPQVLKDGLQKTSEFLAELNG
ncbi:aminotransferase [Vibrio genomosp. F6]|uniref:Aminotransferase n=1 Tax=Vibrio genomosp. F6 str. FF-238 TaxID=1191298 RepID=A0A1E5D4T5_9VIBR|nr:aminotransferase [Vibrio genomosp. F6]OEE78547.1 aminotransferase [Vibrio genomosp. F6 str. FF-238]